MCENRECGVLTDAEVEKVRRHYRHAVEKHPRFADRVIDNYDGGPQTELAANAMWYELDGRRTVLRCAVDNDMVTPEKVLLCEFAEAMEAYARKDYAAAVEECYDAIAVLLRTVDVLEGRQALGKPDAEKEAAS